MKNDERSQQETITSLFDQDLSWWADVYRDDLPRGFFSFEMRKRLKLVAEQLKAQIHKMDNPEVLECGCGPGDILELLAPSPCKLTGLDLNRRYLEMSAKKVPEATLVDGDVEKLPFPDKSFDIVYAVGVLLYVKNDRLAVKEMARVTRDGGYVLISVPNYLMLHLLMDPYYFYRSIRRGLGQKEEKIESGFDESQLRRYPLRQLKKLCKDFGLHEINTMSTSFGPLKFWRKEVLPLTSSIRISEVLRNWSGLRSFSALNHVGNHLIVSLRKGAIP